MPKIYKSAVIGAPIAKVWPLLRDFGGIHKIAPIAKSTEIQGGEPADRIGAVRDIHTHDGGLIRERLVALSDHEHTQTYVILESPLGVTDYEATIHALPVTAGDHTFVEWSASFGCERGREAELVEAIGNGVFAAALEQVKTLIG